MFITGVSKSSSRLGHHLYHLLAYIINATCMVEDKFGGRIFHEPKT
jgi:hypothetical protein